MTLLNPRLIASLISIAGLIACAQVSEVHTADGKPAKLISCHGFSTSDDSCVRQASAECPLGYKVESRGEADDAIQTADFMSLQAHTASS